MRWLVGAWVLVVSLGCLSEPPPAPRPLAAPIAPPVPTGPVESLGGVTQGALFDATGFQCQGPVCEKPAEVAGEHGILVVHVCDGLANQITFRQYFYTPDVAAVRLDKPNKADGMTWVARLAEALKEVGFTMREPSPEETKQLQERLGPQQSSSGKRLEAPQFFFLDHPDGRKRTFTLMEMAAPPEALAADPQASMLRFDVSTSVAKVCTTGI